MKDESGRLSAIVGSVAVLVAVAALYLWMGELSLPPVSHESDVRSAASLLMGGGTEGVGTASPSSDESSDAEADGDGEEDETED